MSPEAPPTLHEPDFNYTGQYTYADYLRWTIEERLEIIKGKLFKMSAPTLNHQVISGNLFLPIGQYLKGKPFQVFSAPFDVRLARKSKADKDVVTVVQPDLCVVCDERKLDRRGCIGAPDLVVEILLPANSKKELKNKYEVYEESGVQEYWIVYPEQRAMHIYRLGADGRFTGLRPLTEGDVLETPVMPGLRLPLVEVFDRVTDLWPD